MTSELFQNGQAVDLLTVLNRREQRVAIYAAYFQKHLDDTIIAIKLNMPGPIKNNELIHIGFQKLLATFFQLVQANNLTYEIIEEAPILISGPEIILASKNEAELWKTIAVQAENASKSARLLDIDVITSTGTITRSMLNLPERTCFLCAEPAKVCARARKHTVKDMQRYISEIWRADSLY